MTEFALAIRNFVGPDEVPDVHGIYAYAERAEALGFEPVSRRMRLEALHPGVTVDHVRAQTPFELLVADRVETTAPPSARELEILRALDPARQFLG